MRAHGNPSTYNHGCRCEPCTTANTARVKRSRVARQQRAEEAPHGLYAYTNWGCRCEVCTAAKSEANAAYWATYRSGTARAAS